MIDQIISEKLLLFSVPFVEKNICLIGSSQLEQWKVNGIAGYKVCNCAVSGITSFEYNEKIIDKNLLACETNAFLVIHRTNGAFLDYTINEMVESIKKNIDYLKKINPTAPIIFLSCLHVNGRIDRNNSRIDVLNKALKKAFDNSAVWIETSFMDDRYGYLDEAYTTAVLYITEAVYAQLKEEIEKTIKRIGL